MEHMFLLWKGVVIVLICSIKPKIKLTVIVILGIIAAIIVSVIIYFNFKGETWVMVAGAQYSIQAGENEQRIDFLKQFGWEVEQEPVSIEEIVIPQQFNQVYERYNELQKTQGMDLTKYAGKTVKKVVYQITNYQRQDTIVHATLLIYHDKVIGGDISSAELDGFMYGFMGEGSLETNQLSGSMVASEIEEASQQSKGEIPTTAYPTDL